MLESVEKKLTPIGLLFYGLVLFTLSLSLIGCSGNDRPQAQPQGFFATDLSQANFQTDFHLTDHNGTARSLADFAGQVVIVFFGFTHCGDVCPTTMANLAQVIKQLGPEAARKIQVLFITVDPERDTPAVLASFVPAFNSSFLGLYGDLKTTNEVVRDFKAFSQKRAAMENEKSYTMDHSGNIYVFDTNGKLRLLVNGANTVSEITHDLRMLMNKAVPQAKGA